MHFPTSHETPAVPVTSNGTNETMQLPDWDRYRVALHTAAVKAGKKSSFHDHSTAFYVPDMSQHLAQFSEDGVPFLTRQYQQEGVTMFVAMVVTPGNGHTLELHAPTCTQCTHITFPAFEADECGSSHVGSKSLSYYQASWQYATSLPGWGKTLGNTSLPTPLLTQLRSALTELSAAEEYLADFVSLAKVEKHSDGQCQFVDMTAGTAPFAAMRSLPSINNTRFIRSWCQASDKLFDRPPMGPEHTGLERKRRDAPCKVPASPQLGWFSEAVMWGGQREEHSY